MSDKDKLAQVEAELAKAKADAAAAKQEAANAVAELAKAKDSSLVQSNSKAKHAEKVAALKAKAATTPDGKHKRYVVGPAGFYRLGQLYREGEEVVLSAKESPSVTFLPVEDGAASKAATPKAPAAAGRPSDQDVA